MTKLLTTERLFIRHLDRNDTAFIVELVNSPRWLTYIGDRDIKTEEAAIDYIERQQKSYTVYEFGLSAVCLKTSGVAIGLCGFLKREDLPARDIGYALLPNYERLGYASEIVAASTINYWETFPEEPILAQVQKDNQASIKLLERLQFEKSENPVTSKNTVLYRKNPN